MNRIGLLAWSLAAGAAAQPSTDEAPRTTFVDYRTLTHLSLVRNLLNAEGFSPRATRSRPIYDTGVPVTGVAATGDFRGPGNGCVIYDDFTTIHFDGPVTVTGMKWGPWYPANSPDHLYMKMEFFPTHVGTNAPATGNPWLGAPIVTNWWDLGTGWSCTSPDCPSFHPTFLDFTDNGGTDFTLPSAGTYGLRMSMWGDVAGVVTPLTTHQLYSRGLMTCWPVGSSDYRRWYGAPADQGNFDLIVNDSLHSTGTSTSTRALWVAFLGLLEATPPPAQSLGVLTDAETTIPGTVDANAVRWFSFSLASDATDDARQFLDIEAQGARHLTLYDAAGDLIASERGTTDGATLSFGMGRRSGTSAFAGRNFDPNAAPFTDDVPGLAAANGPYYLAVAGDPITTSEVWTLNACGSAAATFTLKLRTNTNATPLAPSVPPLVSSPRDDLGLVSQEHPGVIAPIPLLAGEVRWIRFVTCRDTDITHTVTISSARGSANVGGGHALFDDRGNLVASAQAENGLEIPDLRFGGMSTILPAGSYYLALHGGEDATQFDLAPNPEADGRWHLRSRNLSTGYNSRGSVTASWPSCNPCRGVCHADLDDGSGTGTSDGGVTIDDLIFFVDRFQSGGACADLDDGTSTGTVDGGVTIDDLLYFLTRYQRGC